MYCKPSTEYSFRKDNPSICETLVETIYRVLPRHANPLGTLHGGRIMDWMISTATLAATRFSKGPVVLGWLDNIFFLSPVKVGSNVIIQAWISLAGNSSMDVEVLVYSEDYDGKKNITTIAHTAFVAVDDELKPRPIGRKVIPTTNSEMKIYQEALGRRNKRIELIKSRREARKDLSPPIGLWDEWGTSASRIAYPEDAIYSNAMHAGRLLFVLDEIAGILASRYSRGIVVTAAVDSTAFYAPITIGDFYNIYATITYVGRTTVEVTMKVVVENPISGRREHTATAHYTMVHIGEDLRPKPVPKRTIPPERLKIFKEAEERRKLRLERLKLVKEKIKIFS